MTTLRWLVISALAASACGDVKDVLDAAGGDAPNVQIDAAVDAAVAPSLTGVLPAKGKVTTSVTLTGTGFGATAGSGMVMFDTLAANVISWTNTSIVVSVPMAAPGPTNVTITTVGGTTGPQVFRVVLPPAVYVNNDLNDAGLGGANTVAAFALDEMTGALVAIGTPLSVGSATSGYGGCSSNAWLHERTRRLFATGTTTLAVFNIDPVTGALTPAPGSPVTIGAQSYTVITDAAGTRAFVTSYGARQIAVFDIAGNGQLTAVPGSPFPVTISTDTMALGIADGYLYANSFGSQRVAYSVAANGALALVAGPQAGSNTSIQRRAGHDQLYLGASGPTLAVLALAATGAATAVAGSPFTTTTTGTSTPAFTSDGNRVYLASDSSGVVAGYNLDALGVPTAIMGSPFTLPSLTDISCTAVSQDGSFLVVLGETQNTIGVSRLDAVGVPTPVLGSPFANAATGASPGGLAISF